MLSTRSSQVPVLGTWQWVAVLEVQEAHSTHPWAVEFRCVAAGPSQGLCAKPVLVSCRDLVKPGGIKSRLL